jgi:hypothetical protein
VIDLDDERYPMGVFAGYRAQNPKRRGDCIATALDSQFNDFRRVEIVGILAKDAPAECSMPWSIGRIDT